MNRRREVIREMLGGESPKSTPPTAKQSKLHKVTAGGCYFVAAILAIAAMAVMWVLVFNPNEMGVKILIAAITGLASVVFLWLLLIKRW
jgi:hypothetical protein